MQVRFLYNKTCFDVIQSCICKKYFFPPNFSYLEWDIQWFSECTIPYNNGLFKQKALITGIWYNLWWESGEWSCGNNHAGIVVRNSGGKLANSSWWHSEMEALSPAPWVSLCWDCSIMGILPLDIEQLAAFVNGMPGMFVCVVVSAIIEKTYLTPNIIDRE